MGGEARPGISRVRVPAVAGAWGLAGLRHVLEAERPAWWRAHVPCVSQFVGEFRVHSVYLEPRAPQGPQPGTTPQQVESDPRPGQPEAGVRVRPPEHGHPSTPRCQTPPWHLSGTPSPTHSSLGVTAALDLGVHESSKL